MMALEPAEKVQRYRERMTDRGMRQLTIWVPDSRSPRIIEEARRQSLLVSENPVPEEEIIDGFWQYVAEDEEWT
jgi:hypothetical protein